MHFLNLLLIDFLCMLAQLTVATPAPLGGPLEKRQCSINGCECVPGIHPSQYCWGCKYVTKGGSDPSVDYRGWIYECAPTGRCCTYGPRNSCNNAADPCWP
ncbi:uncharacterized protein H6S33_004928 [Morchella sextelata]|uniref:uncharacterized protein n=1 Tax=Morchella sextelata TaxID=1174677 RepID=UPI001D0562D5|nr:uncharacterized protein H6S33_004928 [Morchella sextelata]KAH0604946.1 hypothetical protein H6S33_004928 [Morchella sextelata]